jgi:hypothetical protein
MGAFAEKQESSSKKQEVTLLVAQVSLLLDS